MKVTTGDNDRSHFRLEVEKQTVPVQVMITEKEQIHGFLKDVSDGGIAFTLNEIPLRDLTDLPAKVSFVIDDRMFQFDMKILRKFSRNQIQYYAGEFIVTSKIKQSQLSLLLMKMKLITKKER